MLITAAQTIKALIDDSISPALSIPHSVHEAGHKGVGPGAPHSLLGFAKREV